MGVQGGGSRCSVVSSCSVLPQTFLFRLQGNLLQDGAPPALPRNASALPPAGEKTRVIKEHSVGYRKQVLTSSPALIRQQEDTTSPLLNSVPRILFGHQNDIAAMLESDKRQK